MSEEELLQKMLDIWNEAKEQGTSREPAQLRGHPDAEAYFRLLQAGFEKAAGGHGSGTICLRLRRKRR